DEQDPLAVLDADGVPTLPELNLHNGTIYRWNRPVFAVSDGQPHVRVENRVLPGGPTVSDMLATVAFYAGLVRALASADRSVWSQMSYSAAKENFDAGVARGLQARVTWLGCGMVLVTELVLRKLLPLAAGGLADWGVGADEIDRYLGIIEQRCLRGRNGATWQTANVGARERRGSSRTDALNAMLGDYLERMHSNEPV